MDNMMDFLESSPLVGFQMDGTHLHSVLQRIIQEQQQQAHFQRQVGQRLTDMESELRNLSMRQKEIEKALGNLGSDSFRTLRQQLDELDQGLDNLAREVKDARQLGAEAADAAADCTHGLQNMGRELGVVQDRQERLLQNLDDIGVEMGRQNRQFSESVKNIEREQTLQGEHIRNIVRDLEEEGSRENFQKLRDLLNEFCDRTDKNFHNVEESARAVDAELHSHRTDINALQGDMVLLQDKVRQGLSNVGKDVDLKCQMIIDTLREHEKSSLELEEHMVAAGQALARRQALKQQRGLSGSRRNGW